MNDTDTISMTDALAQTPSNEDGISMEEVLGNEAPSDKPIRPIPEEHRTQFIKSFGDAVYNGFINTGLRLGGAVNGAVADINDVIGTVTGLNNFKAYRENMVEYGRGMRDLSRELLPANNTFERTYYGFIDAVGSLTPTLPFDVMTGGATKIALAGRILPKMEAILARIPNFALGSGWRGMVEGINGSQGSIPEKAVAGVLGAGESIAINTLFAHAGIGLKGIGNMAALGAAQAFYGAAKEGRLPTEEELTDNTTQAALLGVVFTALPHLAEGSQIRQEKAVLKAYSDKFEAIMPKDVKTYSINGDPAEIHKIATDLITDERIRPEVREALLEPFLDRLNQRGDIAPQEFKLGQWKDQSKLRMMRETMERVIENTAGGEAKAVQAETTEKIKENETYRRRWQTELNTQIQGKEMWDRGVRPNTPDSMYAMRFGEGRMTEAELQQASPKNWENIKKAAEYSRSVYDETLDALNIVRERYGYEPIAKREDYFRHFQEISVASQLVGHFLGGEKPPTSIAGVINRSKYGKPFTSTEMERMGGEFKEDAVLAMQNYIKSAGQQLFHLDSVQRIRALERYIRTQALLNETALQEGRPYTKIDLSNYVERLSTYADLLAGQPSAITQAVNRNIDRPLVAGVRALQRNVILNMIAHNVSAAFMNILPGAQQVATTNPKAVVKGMVTSMLHLNRNVPFEMDGARSEFYDRRYPKDFLPANWQELVADKGFILPNVVDRMMVQSLIAGKYFEGKEQGLTPIQAMKAADNYAVKVVTDRSTGQVPPIMAEPDLKLISAFQVEINNLWSWLAHDVPAEAKGKLAGAIGRIAVFALASNMINNVYEKMMGRRPQLDFLYILGTLAGVTEAGKNRGFLERMKPAAKDLVGNVPFGNLFVEGGRFPLAAAFPDMNVILDDPEHKMLSEFAKPIFYAIPFGGGGQVRKTMEGLNAWNKGYVATPSGNMRYEVQKDFYNLVRAFLFGKNAFPEAVRYWNQPKSER